MKRSLPYLPALPLTAQNQNTHSEDGAGAEKVKKLGFSTFWVLRNYCCSAAALGSSEALPASTWEV